MECGLAGRDIEWAVQSTLALIHIDGCRYAVGIPAGDAGAYVQGVGIVGQLVVAQRILYRNVYIVFCFAGLVEDGHVALSALERLRAGIVGVERTVVCVVKPVVVVDAAEVGGIRRNGRHIEAQHVVHLGVEASVFLFQRLCATAGQRLVDGQVEVLHIDVLTEVDASPLYVGACQRVLRLLHAGIDIVHVVHAAAHAQHGVARFKRFGIRPVAFRQVRNVLLAGKDVFLSFLRIGHHNLIPIGRVLQYWNDGCLRIGRFNALYGHAKQTTAVVTICDSYPDIATHVRRLQSIGRSRLSFNILPSPHAVGRTPHPLWFNPTGVDVGYSSFELKSKLGTWRRIGVMHQRHFARQRGA